MTFMLLWSSMKLSLILVSITPFPSQFSQVTQHLPVQWGQKNLVDIKRHHEVIQPNRERELEL